MSLLDFPLQTGLLVVRGAALAAGAFALLAGGLGHRLSARADPDDCDAFDLVPSASATGD